MHKNTVLFVIIAGLGGFIAGFMLANSINRSSSPFGKAADTTPATAKTTPGKNDQDLSPAEIKAKIAEADKDPSNFTFQKDLGIGLYRYANLKQDPDVLDEATRILARANELQPNNFDVLVALGNARFDSGYANKDNKGFLAARDLYTKALQIKPADADVATDRGLTYFFQVPPDYDRAVTELQKVGEANPQHERSVQFLVQAYVKQNKLQDADRALARLRTIDPQNDSLSELESLISSARNPSK